MSRRSSTPDKEGASAQALTEGERKEWLEWQEWREWKAMKARVLAEGEDLEAKAATEVEEASRQPEAGTALPQQEPSGKTDPGNKPPSVFSGKMSVGRRWRRQ